MELSIAQMAERTGLSADTLRYYERDGLMLQPPARSATGHRRYSADDVTWVELVTRLRATGMPIRDVRRYAEMVRAGEGTEAERMELLKDHRRQVLAQLAEVTEHLEAIDYKINLYAERLERHQGIDLDLEHVGPCERDAASAIGSRSAAGATAPGTEPDDDTAERDRRLVAGSR